MNITRGRQFISFEVDEVSREAVERALGDLSEKAPQVLKAAVNKTAKNAKEDLARKAQETYVVKKTRFTKAMKTKNATNARPQAIINVTGEQLELKDFKVSPASYRPKNRPAVLKGKVLASGSLKALDLVRTKKSFLSRFFKKKSAAGHIRAFVAKFKNGHLSVVQRKTGNRFPLRKLLSSSVPVMVGSKKRVYGIVEPNIYNNLINNLNKEIERQLNK